MNENGVTRTDDIPCSSINEITAHRASDDAAQCMNYLKLHEFISPRIRLNEFASGWKKEHR